MAASRTGNTGFQMEVKWDRRSLQMLEARLLSLGDKVGRKEYRAATGAGARLIVKQARVNLEPHKRTGKLRKSLRVNTRIDYTKEAFTAQITNRRDTFYGMFLEFGTEKFAGIHWLQRAAEAKTPEIVATIANRISKRLSRLSP